MNDRPQRGPEPRPANENRPVPAETRLGDDLVMGLRFYSRLPTGPRQHVRPNLSRMALALPFTSLVIGAGPVAVLLALEWLGTPHLFSAALAVAVMVIVSGAMAEDAIADAADGLFGGATIEDRLAIMKDSRHGTYGVSAIVLLLGLRIAAVGSVANPLEAAGIWLAAGVMARSGALWLTLALPPARSGGAAASAGAVTRQAFGVGAVFAVVLSFVLAGFAVGVLGLIAAYGLCVLVVWGWVTLCRRLIGGQTGDLIGALQALLEIAALTAFMIFV
ncbi:MAG: adenosylcobinamide-GDP ribazoletransferase [Devosia nanyangense]|uniref:Adenosylcobinamide-GDP ribazoletransferase n=1 Tax=Devosia nanyangense TaxID=1228055 RepID=A0A933NXH2_9HYPH|nr:adenosylcobinamide-GDP ribazoletransferase [Devosia nanyangense]